MKYLIDFDHTLLDTDRFVAQVVADGRENDLVTSGIWQFYNVRDYLYEDVLGWLRSKAKEDLHILTAMTPSLGSESCDFQREKLHSGNFTEFVESITFMVGEKGEAAAEIASQFPPHEPLVFIDDRLDQCLSVKVAIPEAHCFMIVREGDLSVAVPPEVSVVSNLAEVDVIMNKSV